MNFFVQAFSEANGSPSSMRLITAIVVCSIMVGWLSVTIHTNTIAPLGIDGPGGVLLGCLGIKAFQKGRETKPTSETTFIEKKIS